MFSRIIINRFKYFGITCGIFAGSIGFLGLNYKYNFEDIKKKIDYKTLVYFKPDTIDLQKYIISFLPKLKDKSINFDNITPKF